MKILRSKDNESLLYYVLLVLSCLNVFSNGSTIFLAFCLYALQKRRIYRFPIDGNIIAALLLFGSVLSASIVYYGLMDMIRSLNYLFPCFIGFTGYMNASDKVGYAKKVMFSLFIGFSLHIFLLYIYNLSIGITSGRVMYSIWTGEPTSVTLIGLLGSVAIGYSFYGIFVSKNKFLKILSVLAIVLVLFFNSNTATRTPFLILGGVTVFMCFVYLFSNSVKRAFKAILVMAVIIAVVALVFAFDIGGAKTYVMDSPIFQRFVSERLESPRMEIIMYHLEHMWEYPFGGGHMRDAYSHAHNYLQEAHDLYGVGALLALLVYLVVMIKNIIALITRKHKQDVDYLFISMYLAIFIQIIMEPVITGFPLLLWGFLMIHGMATAHIRCVKMNARSITVRES